MTLWLRSQAPWVPTAFVTMGPQRKQLLSITASSTVTLSTCKHRGCCRQSRNPQHYCEDKITYQGQLSTRTCSINSNRWTRPGPAGFMAELWAERFRPPLPDFPQSRQLCIALSPSPFPNSVFFLLLHSLLSPLCPFPHLFSFKI